MSMYTICGHVFYGNELYHGLGRGSGRGRPKGSRNGYISPGAAYMKNYQVVGEKAEGGQDTSRRQQSGGGIIKKDGTRLRAANYASSGVAGARRRTETAPQRRSPKTPASATAKGREFMNRQSGAADYGRGYNMRSDPYSGRGAAENEPAGYDMHADPYNENSAGSAEEGTQKEGLWGRIKNALGRVAPRVVDTAVKAIETGRRAFVAARDWVTKAVSDVGKFAKTAYNTAAKWVGDRARDLDRWWNGYDTRTANQLGEITTTHTNGARENIRNAVGSAARTATNAGHAAENAVLGTPTYNMHSDPYGDPQYSGRSGGVFGRGGVVDQTRDYVQGVADRVDTAASNFQNQIARNPLVRATGEAINGTYDMHSDPYGDAQYNGGVLGENGLVDQAGQLATRGVDWANQNVVQPAGRLWNQGVDWANQNVVQPGINLGRHIVNAPPALNAAPASSNAGDNFNEAVSSVSSSDLAQEAVARGVPQATINQLSEQYAYGLISAAALEQQLRNLAGYR